MKIRIYYHHTDCGGVVYYSKYLDFLEEARTDFFEQNNLPLTKLYDQGVFFVVARQEIDYKAPAFYGDTLEINSRLSNVGNARIEFSYEIKNQEGKVISLAATIMACVNKDFKPQSIPQEVKSKLT